MIETSVLKLKYSFPGEEFVPVEGHENTFDLVHGRNEFAIQILVLSEGTNQLVGIGYVVDTNTIRVNCDPNNKYIITVVL